MATRDDTVVEIPKKKAPKEEPERGWVMREIFDRVSPKRTEALIDDNLELTVDRGEDDHSVQVRR